MSDKFITTRGDVTQVAASPKRPQSEGNGTIYKMEVFLFGQSGALVYYVIGMTAIASIRGDFDGKKSQSYVYKNKFSQGTVGFNWANVAALICCVVIDFDNHGDENFLYT